MRPLTRPGLLVAIALAVVVLPTVASGALSAPAAPQAPAANTTTYTDSSGENAAAPDITTLTVSNSDAGVVQFRVAIPNRAQFTPDMLLLVFVDSDANPQTGDAWRGVPGQQPIVVLMTLEETDLLFSSVGVLFAGPNVFRVDVPVRNRNTGEIAHGYDWFRVTG